MHLPGSTEALFKLWIASIRDLVYIRLAVCIAARKKLTNLGLNYLSNAMPDCVPTLYSLHDPCNGDSQISTQSGQVQLGTGNLEIEIVDA